MVLYRQSGHAPSKWRLTYNLASATIPYLFRTKTINLNLEMVHIWNVKRLELGGANKKNEYGKMLPRI